MKTYIVLLRGVMPSGKNSIKMAFGFSARVGWVAKTNTLLR